MTKFEKLYHEMIDIIDHAERNEHISEDGADVLRYNLDVAKEDIKNNPKYE